VNDRPITALSATPRPYGPPQDRVGLFWRPDAAARTATASAEVGPLLRMLSDPLAVCETPLGLQLCLGGRWETSASTEALPVRAFVPPMPPQALGCPEFARTHGLRFTLVAGAMANGITSVDLVVAMARAGMMGFFGAAGLSLPKIETALQTLETTLLDAPWGSNLIHSPYEPEHERAVSELYRRREVRRVSASAYLKITPALVAYRLHQVREEGGRIVVPNHLFAKLSRTELAEQFLAPAPPAIVEALRRAGELTEAQALLAPAIPLASAITAEADSGGHTDNRPALCLLPAMIALRNRRQSDFPGHRLAVGAAGGIGTPSALWAAYAMGADYALTGSVNQACREAGTSDAVRRLLATAEPADVAMAPAADMFEMGVKLQVLRRGTMFASRAQKLWELYRSYTAYEDIPQAERAWVEKNVLGQPYEAVWAETEAFWQKRDPSRLRAAATDPKRRMALCFRWYLGMSSRWANAGTAGREGDYQIWCGPAMGAFNAWVAGSPLAAWNERSVGAVACNLLHGAAVRARVAMLAAQGIAIDPRAVDDRPRTIAELEAWSA